MMPRHGTTLSGLATTAARLERSLSLGRNTLHQGLFPVMIAAAAFPTPRLNGRQRSIIGLEDEMAWSRSGSVIDGNQGRPAGAYHI
jgi:hypothetical protein